MTGGDDGERLALLLVGLGGYRTFRVDLRC